MLTCFYINVWEQGMGGYGFFGEINFVSKFDTTNMGRKSILKAIYALNNFCRKNNNVENKEIPLRRDKNHFDSLKNHSTPPHRLKINGWSLRIFFKNVTV